MQLDSYRRVKECLFTRPRLLFMNLWQLVLSLQDTTQSWECSRSIATAVGWFICSYDMWAWRGWLSGCMTAKSVLLNNCYCFQKTSCVGPWHNHEKCCLLLFLPAAMRREMKLFYGISAAVSVWKTPGLAKGELNEMRGVKGNKICCFCLFGSLSSL